MKKLTLFALFLLLLTTLNAQSEKQLKASQMKYGKIDPEHLNMTQYDKDTSANAVILAKQGEISFYTNSVGIFSIRLHQYKRIKILKKAAIAELSRFSIAFSNNQYTEQINNFKAHIVQPNGTTTKLVEGRDFLIEIHEDTDNRLDAIFRDLQVGSIIEYAYDHDVNPKYRIDELFPWTFQEKYPILRCDLEVVTPTVLSYKSLMNDEKKIKRYELGTEYIPYGITEFVDLAAGKQNLTHLKLGYEFPQTDVKAKCSRVLYRAEYIEAFAPNTKFINRYDDYALHIFFQLHEILESDNNKHAFIESWKTLSDNLWNWDRLGLQISNKQNYDRAWKAIQPKIHNSQSNVEKIRIIYHFLSQKLQWNGKNSFYAEERTLDAVFDEGKGNSAELNLLFVALMREAGINAHPCLVSTRDNGKPITSYPVMWQFNHTIAYAEIQGKTYFMDIGNKYRPFDIARKNSLNTQGFILEKANPRWADLNTAAESTVHLFNFKMDNNGHISGSINSVLSGYAAIELRSLLKKSIEKPNITLIDSVLGKMPNTTILNIAYDNIDSAHLPVKRNIDIAINNQHFDKSDKYDIQPLYLSHFRDNPFVFANKTYPIDFQCPLKDQYIYNLTIPEGYMFEKIPQNMSLSFSNNTASAQLSSSIKENTLQIVFKTNINATYFSAENYESISLFFKQLIDKQNEQIVVKKL